MNSLHVGNFGQDQKNGAFVGWPSGKVVRRAGDPREPVLIPGMGTIAKRWAPPPTPIRYPKEGPELLPPIVAKRLGPEEPKGPTRIPGLEPMPMLPGSYPVRPVQKPDRPYDGRSPFGPQPLPGSTTPFLTVDDVTRGVTVGVKFPF